MSTENASGSPEVQTRASVLQTLVGDAKTVTLDVEDAVQRALAGIERWYAEHFHAAAVAGTQPITSADKAALTAHVAAAIRPVKE